MLRGAGKEGRAEDREEHWAERRKLALGMAGGSGVVQRGGKGLGKGPYLSSPPGALRSNYPVSEYNSGKVWAAVSTGQAVQRPGSCSHLSVSCVLSKPVSSRALAFSAAEGVSAWLVVTARRKVLCERLNSYILHQGSASYSTPPSVPFS